MSSSRAGFIPITRTLKMAKARACGDKMFIYPKRYRILTCANHWGAVGKGLEPTLCLQSQRSNEDHRTNRIAAQGYDHDARGMREALIPTWGSDVTAES